MIGAYRASLLIVCAGALWLVLSAWANEPRVSIAVEGARVQFEPGQIRLRIRVERDKYNRALTVALVSDGFERSSLEQLEGESSPLVRWVDYRDVPAGEYVVIAIVHRPEDRPIRAEDRLQVLSRF